MAIEQGPPPKPKSSISTTAVPLNLPADPYHTLPSNQSCPYSFAKTISSQCRSRDNNLWFSHKLPESLLEGYTYHLIELAKGPAVRTETASVGSSFVFSECACTETLHFLSISSFQIRIPRSSSFQKIPHKQMWERENGIRKQSIKKWKKQNETIKREPRFMFQSIGLG